MKLIESNCIPLFPNLVHKLNFVDFDNDDIIKKSYHLKSIEQGVQKTNVKGWQSDSIIDNQNFKPFLETLFHGVSSYLKFDFEVTNAWLNINSPGSYNISHIHPNSTLSGVFWMQTPDNCGNIVFENSNRFCSSPLMKYYDDNLNNIYNHHDTFYFIPKSGLMILFPSDLSHHVEENQSDIDRISLSFNFVIK